MSKRVLVVNDSAAVLQTLNLVLRRAGYEVDVADRPDIALAKASEADLMLCDSMVGDDKEGAVAREALRRNNKLKVLLWIGGGEQPMEFMRRHLGGFWTLPKPIDPALLLTGLSRALAFG